MELLLEELLERENFISKPRGQNNPLKVIKNLARRGDRKPGVPVLKKRKSEIPPEKYASLFRRKHFLVLRQAGYRVLVLDSLNKEGRTSMACCLENDELKLYLVDSLKKCLSHCLITSFSDCRFEYLISRGRFFMKVHGEKIKQTVETPGSYFIGTGMFIY